MLTEFTSTFIRLVRAHINNEHDLEFLRFARGVDAPFDLRLRPVDNQRGLGARERSLPEVAAPRVHADYFDVWQKTLPPRQSVSDFGGRLAFGGCAIAMVAYMTDEIGGRPLAGKLDWFSRLPRCALQRALGHNEGGGPRMAISGPPAGYGIRLRRRRQEAAEQQHGHPAPLDSIPGRDWLSVGNNSINPILKPSLIEIEGITGPN
ncbi:hypothetical protein B0T24DRAFT_600152 [Lasiosphaeria ovina]|uniref:Uncharacterized protein n=1 Tax=Lasiosphaeria ovina TaxID=92902 RepID=A0AAE0JRU3_9PEZI|nr:hypothetical protein B0T24DRAFT_600152 [Lasiosphaeria ovina]